MKVGFYFRVTIMTLVAIAIVTVASYFTIKEFLWNSIHEIAAAEKEQLQLHVGNTIASELPAQFQHQIHFSLLIYSPTAAMNSRKTITINDENKRISGTLENWPSDIPKKTGKYAYNGNSVGLTKGEYIAHVMALEFPSFNQKDFEKRVQENSLSARAEQYAQSATSMLLTIAKVFMWVIAGIIIMYFVLGKSFKSRLAKIELTLSRFSDGQLSSRLPEQHLAKGDELGTLSQRVNDTLDKTERLVSGLDRMTSQISHELKDELSSLERKLTEASATVVSERVDAMRSLIDEILELVRLESDVDDNSDIFYLANPIIEAVQVYADSFEDADIALELSGVEADCGPRILGRPALISRLVANLLSNILRYAAESQRVSIHLSTVKQLVTLAISDEGPGLLVDDVDTLAKEARQRDNAQGYGAGLRFVRAVAIRHGGNVRLNTTKKGLTVLVQLPVHQAS
ncbi:MAG: HAMP domain-containing sensor histidine kinase [Spongiibacteraceae bacterium]